MQVTGKRGTNPHGDDNLLESLKTNPCEHSVKVGAESEIKSFAEEVLTKKTKIIKKSYISTSFIPPQAM